MPASEKAPDDELAWVASEPMVAEGWTELGFRCGVLAFAFGFGQGVCNNIFLSSAGFWGARFEDENFFVWMCAAVYIAPFLVFLLASWLDPYFDSRFGLRTMFQGRMAASLIASTLLVASLSLACSLPLDSARQAVLVLGALIGMLSGAVASATMQFFGAVGSHFVPLFFLGQTASGTYINLAAYFLQFQPGCTAWISTCYFTGCAAVALFPGMVFMFWQKTGYLDGAYNKHVQPQIGLTFYDTLPRSPFSSGGLNGVLLRVEDEEPDEHRWEMGLEEKPLVTEKGGEGLKKLAIMLQILTVGLNISLTPLANVIARGNFHLGQVIVLTKLLGDFLGRVSYFAIPEPRQLERHMLLNWIMTVFRIPVWIVVLIHSFAKEPLLSDGLLLTLWLPFVIAAALGGSWAQTIAIKAMPESKKRSTASEMNIAVYLGFFSGVLFAAGTVLLRH